ncbi:MAG TPA: hypothetical protein VK622_02400, partial [Puia sp.]|nr:hypothetical protein [Puia sp.]
MLYINPNSSEVKMALDQHRSAVRCFIWKKIGACDDVGAAKNCGKVDCKICRGKIKAIENIPLKILEYFRDDLNVELLIGCEPTEIEGMDRTIWNDLIPGLNYNEWIKIMNKTSDLTEEEKQVQSIIASVFEVINKIVDYDNWFVKKDPGGQYSAYHLAKSLNRRSCTYCNRTYTTTMTTTDGGKLMRPQFDHWFPQSKYPLFALSFFNLIPSCNICNSSSKGDTILKLSEHVHPYVDSDQTNEFRFNYFYSVNLNVYRIFVQSTYGVSKKVRNTLKELEVDTMYNAHHAELDDLIKLKAAYSKEYLKSLKTAFPKANLTDAEIYRMALGVELNTQD